MAKAWQARRPWGWQGDAKPPRCLAIALCGSLGPGAEDAYSEGITAAFSAVRGPCDFQEIQRTCREDMARLAEAVLGLWALGQAIPQAEAGRAFAKNE